MYWTDSGVVDKIERASMDGTGRIAIHSTGLTLPYGLTIDIDTQTLYWTDYSRSVIEKSNADGTNRAILTNTLILNPYFLTYYDGSLFWGDWTQNAILTTSVNSPDNVRFFSRLNTDVYAIEAISSDKQHPGYYHYTYSLLY